MKIKLDNGSVLKSIKSNDCKRSERATIYYYKKNPYEFIEDFYGVKLNWYQKIWIEFDAFVEKWRQLWRK